MPVPKIDIDQDTRDRLLEAMSLDDIDERARAGMNQQQSDSFIGFDKLLDKVPLQSAPKRQRPQKHYMHVDEIQAAQRKHQNQERNQRLEQSLLVGGPTDSPDVQWEGNENVGPLSAMKAFGHVPQLPDGRYVQGIRQQGLQPGDLEHLKAVLERYRR